MWKRAVISLIGVALVTGGLATQAALRPVGATSSTTGAFFDGEAGSLHQGPLPLPTVTLSGNPTYLQLQVSGPHDSFEVELAPPSGSQLAVGVYENAERASFRSAGHPGLDIFGDGVGCNTVSGRFIIDDLTITAGSVVSIAARFEHHCEGQDVALFGSVSYQSTVANPQHTISPEPVTFSAASGQMSAVSHLRVTNSGTASLGIGSASVSGSDASDFSLSPSSSCLNTTLTAGQSCTFDLTMTANAPSGMLSGILTFFDDLAPPGGTGRDIALNGTVTAGNNGEFTPLTPARIFDTRDGTGGHRGPVNGGNSIDVQVDGQGGVPMQGVAGVVLNVTVTDTTGFSYLTVWPTGVPQPVISNLNFVPGQTVPNLVTVKVGSNGQLSVFNYGGAADVIFDVVGFYSDGAGIAGSRFHAIGPSRLFDTRTGQGGVAAHPVGQQSVLHFTVAGSNGVPTGATGVVMNVTVTNPTFPSYLTVYPDDVSTPLASNLNFVGGETVPNLVTVRVPSSGVIDFFNFGGSTDVLADVVGYYDNDKSTDAGRLITLSPQRVLDTRNTPPPLGPGGVGALGIAGFGVVPASAASVVLNVTATQPTAPSFLTVFSDDLCPNQIPFASNLNFVPGQTVPNLAISAVSTGSGCTGQAGVVDFYNFEGTTDVVVDVFGYFTSSVGASSTSGARASTGGRGTWRAVAQGAPRKG